jgi:hypothetical protein
MLHSIFAKFEIGKYFSDPSSDVWNDSSNWSDNSVPNSIDAYAAIIPNNTSSRTITIDTDITVGELVFSGGNVNTTLAVSSGSLTFDTTSGNAKITFIGALSGNPSIPFDITVNTSLDVLHATKDGLSVLCGGKLNADGVRITKLGSGTVDVEGGGSGIADNVDEWVNGQLAIKEGSVRIKWGPNTAGGSTGPVIELYLGAFGNDSVVEFNNWAAYPTVHEFGNDFDFKRQEDAPNNFGAITMSGSPVAGHVVDITGDFTGDLTPSGFNVPGRVTFRGGNTYHPVATRGFFLKNDLSGLTSSNSKTDLPNKYRYWKIEVPESWYYINSNSVYNWFVSLSDIKLKYDGAENLVNIISRSEGWINGTLASMSDGVTNEFIYSYSVNYGYLPSFIIDLAEPKNVTDIRWYYRVSNDFYLPKTINVYGSNDNNTYSLVNQITLTDSSAYWRGGSVLLSIQPDISIPNSTPLLYSQSNGPVKITADATLPSEWGLIAGDRLTSTDLYGDCGFVSDTDTNLGTSLTQLETASVPTTVVPSPVIGSIASGTTVWPGKINVNVNDSNNKTPAYILANGDTILELSGNVLGGKGSAQPLIKKGSGILNLTGSANQLIGGSIILQQGSINVNGSFVTPDTTFFVGNAIAKVTLSGALVSGDTLTVVVNGTSYSQSFTTSSDNTLRLLITRIAKNSTVAEASITLVSEDLTSTQERELVITSLGHSFISVTARRLGSGTATVSVAISRESVQLNGTGVLPRVSVADSNQSVIRPINITNNTAGTMTVGFLTLNNMSIYQVEFSNGSYSKIAVTGNLVLDGSIELNDSDYLVPGVYDVITWEGSLVDNGVIVGYVGNGLSASLVVDTGNRRVRITVS